MNTLCQPSDLMPRRIRQELCPAAAGPKFRPWLPLALASLKGRCRARFADFGPPLQPNDR